MYSDFNLQQPSTQQQQPPNVQQQQPPNHGSGQGGKYSTIYVSKGSAGQILGEILYNTSDTVDKIREAISMECGVPPGFHLKISSHIIEPGRNGFELVSRFLNPDFPVVVVDPE